MTVSVFNPLTPAPQFVPDPDAVKRRVHEEACAHLDRYAHVLSPTATVLDVGVGPGRTAQLIRDAHPQIDIVGLDVIDCMREDIRLVLYNGRDIPFEADVFDVVLLQYTLHHAEAPKRVLEECKRVASRAIVVIEEFDLPGIDVELEEMKEAATLAALGLPQDLHHAPLERADLERMFDNLNLTITTSERLETRSTRYVEKRLYVLEVQ